MSDTDLCFIWGTQATVQDDVDKSYYSKEKSTVIPEEAEFYWIDSPRTDGKYKITIEAREELERNEFNDPRFKAKLTTWIIEQRKNGETAPLITVDILKKVKNRPKLSITDRMNNLLLSVYKKTNSTVGVKLEIESKDSTSDIIYDTRINKETKHPITAYSESVNHKEGWFIIKFLEENGYVKLENNVVYEDINKGRCKTDVSLTIKGIQRIEEIQKANVESDKVFVAMWFGDEMNSVYESAIAPAIEAMGYRPIRIDRKEHNNKIDDEIIAEIKRSKFLVADFSQGKDGARGGVYYEAGFAHGRNMQVIFTCRAEDEEEIHKSFDTRQHNHIFWENEKDLKKKLKNRIGALPLREGP